MPAKQSGQQEFTLDGVTRAKPKQRPRKISAALATATALKANRGKTGAEKTSAERSNGAAGNSTHTQQELDLGF